MTEKKNKNLILKARNHVFLAEYGVNGSLNNTIFQIILPPKN